MRLDRALYEYFVAGIKTTFRCSGEFCATMISGRENSTPDTWIACSQSCAGGASAARDSQSTKLERIAAIASGMFAVLERRHLAARMGAQGSGPGAIQLEAEGTRGSAALILMCMKLSLRRSGRWSRRGN